MSNQSEHYHGWIFWNSGCKKISMQLKTPRIVPRSSEEKSICCMSSNLFRKLFEETMTRATLPTQVATIGVSKKHFSIL